MHPARIALPLLAALLLPMRAVAAAPPPFWQAFAGTWISEASYVDAQMRPIVARYAVLTQVETDGEGVVITEWKFYPESPLARGMAGGKLPTGRGLETVTRSSGRASAADPAVVEFGADRGRWTAVLPDVGTGVIAGRGPAPRYRFVATLGGPAHAVFATYGYADDGELKGLALFRMRRIEARDVAGRLEALRREFAVGLTLDSREPRP